MTKDSGTRGYYIIFLCSNIHFNSPASLKELLLFLSNFTYNLYTYLDPKMERVYMQIHFPKPQWILYCCFIVIIRVQSETYHLELCTISLIWANCSSSPEPPYFWWWNDVGCLTWHLILLLVQQQVMPLYIMRVVGHKLTTDKTTEPQRFMPIQLTKIILAARTGKVQT